MEQLNLVYTIYYPLTDKELKKLELLLAITSFMPSKLPESVHHNMTMHVKSMSQLLSTA